MATLQDIHKPQADRVLGIDASTFSIAYTLYTGRKPRTYGKLMLRGNTAEVRVGDILPRFRELLKSTKPDIIAVEAAAYVNSHAVTVKLAHVVGAIMAAAGEQGIRVVTVPALTWMSHIGNPGFDKKYKKKIAEQYSLKGGRLKTKLREIRKQNTIDYMRDNYGFTETDDDICDSFGVAIYTYDVTCRRKK